MQHLVTCTSESLAEEQIEIRANACINHWDLIFSERDNAKFGFESSFCLHPESNTLWKIYKTYL